MKYIGKMAETESLLSTCCITQFSRPVIFQNYSMQYIACFVLYNLCIISKSQQLIPFYTSLKETKSEKHVKSGEIPGQMLLVQRWVSIGPEFSNKHEEDHIKSRRGISNCETDVQERSIFICCMCCLRKSITKIGYIFQIHNLLGLK